MKLPSGGKQEFPRLQELLCDVEASLATASEGVKPALAGATDQDIEAADAKAVAAHEWACEVLAEMGPRAEVFEKRAREKDPDKVIYGPKMVQKVLALCEGLQAAADHAEELRDALAPAKQRQKAARDAAEARAVAAAEAMVAAERHEAEQAAQEMARAAEETRLAAEQAAQDRAAAIAAPLRGRVMAPSADSAGEMDERGRRQLIPGLSVDAALDVLQDRCGTAADHAEALQALHLLCTHIVGRPEERMFRTVRLLNAAFQRSVARHAGGVEALLAMGFVESESLEAEEDAVFYVLEEPSLEDDYEGWAAWYETVKAHRDVLQLRMDAIGVRALPSAAKGTGWSESTKPAAPFQLGDCLTLHGQRGGGL